MSARGGARAVRAAGAAIALFAFALGTPAESVAGRTGDTARRAPPQSAGEARPDRALYEEALRARSALQASARAQSLRTEWERVIMRFRRVVARYPQSGYCDNALLAVGDLYRDMARRFKSARYRDDAVQAYRAIVAEYPSSRLGEPALFSVFQIAREKGDRGEVADAGRAYLSAFPDAPRAAEVKAVTRSRGRVQEASLPRTPPPGLVRVFNLRFWTGQSSTRVVLDLEKPVKLRQDRVRGPDRLWVDLLGARLHPNLKDRTFPVGDGLLEQVRIAQNQDDVVRVVLDFKDVRDHNVFYLENPTRLVVDVRGTPRPAVADAQRRPLLPAVSPPPPEETVPPRPGRTWVSQADPSPAPPSIPEVAGDASGEDREELALGPVAASPADLPRSEVPAATLATETTRGEDVDRLPSRRMADLRPPIPLPSPSPPAWRSAPLLIEGAPAPRRPSPPPPAPAASSARAAVVEPASVLPPQVNRAGSYSLARQLGLGARTIVIDPGHGGHDPGSIGPHGLQEKDLVLDVALRLEKLIRSELGADVIMTRSTDVFVPLEERTAIANSKGADLLLSIHANSSRSPRARGIETYFLNFAADAHAEAVAARENAISAATLKDLQSLVKAITLNSKIDESRDFAASVHEAMLSNLKRQDPALPDRGVRTAPFYVLIGANMPSILAEIAFVSHPGEERQLKTPDYRERIARSLVQGVRSYLEALNRTRQLTALPAASTVATKEAPR